MNKNLIPEYLKELLVKQYGENLADEIIEGYFNERYVTIRINTLKSNKEEVLEELNKNNFEYELVEHLKDAVVLKNTTSFKVKASELCQSGKIYLQSLSSQLPPILLNPQGGLDLLDMCAAPGSKTTYLAALSNNLAHITACEVNKIRMERLKYNVNKLGASNINFMLIDSKKLDDYFRFDQILLDAPCSGSGTLSIYDDSFKKISKNLIDNSATLQLQLLKKALTILKPGCEMIYSTCSILDIENEAVVLNALKGTKCEVIPFDEEIESCLPLLPTKIKGALCIKPNKYFEGFFVIKIRKHK